ncbi:alternate-type signal peptide domain-containing protein [Arthrobacter pigmenti]
MNNSTRADRGIMSKATKGVVAGALGIGLLAGGTTFALWSDDATIDGGTVTAGTLDLSTGGDRVWNDVSGGAAATADNVIDPANFLIVPGDTIQLTDHLKIETKGDNIKAKLSVDSEGLTGALADAGATADYTVKTASGAVIAQDKNLADATAWLPQTISGGHTGTYTVEVDVEFPDTGADQDQVGINTQAVLDGIAFKLEQVR